MKAFDGSKDRTQNTSQKHAGLPNPHPKTTTPQKGLKKHQSE